MVNKPYAEGVTRSMVENSHGGMCNQFNTYEHKRRDPGHRAVIQAYISSDIVFSKLQESLQDIEVKNHKLFLLCTPSLSP